MRAELEKIKTDIRESYVAFIDILGFKSMIDNDIEKVIIALDFIEKYCQDYYKFSHTVDGDDFAEFVVTMFSDSIVISIDKDIDTSLLTLNLFIEFISSLQYELLMRGILIRGSITIGELYHKGNFVFGKGLIDAYIIESQIAEYPRIVIDEKLVEFYLSQKEMAGKWEFIE